MNTFLITLALASPDPTAMEKTLQIVEKEPRLNGYMVEVCVDEECQTVDRTTNDLFNPSQYDLQWRLAKGNWITVKGNPADDARGDKASSGKGSSAGSPSGGVGSSSPKPVESAEVAGGLIGGLVNEIIGATGATVTVEVEVEDKRADGSSTTVKVKAAASKGGNQMKGQPVSER